ncbi:MAG: prephenate dehydratase [Spirochaeta sp.]
MVVFIDHADSAETRSDLMREISLLGARYTLLPGSMHGILVQGVTEAAVEHLRSLDGVIDSVILEWEGSEYQRPETMCSCGGVPIGGGRITPIVRVYGSTGEMVDRLRAARKAGAVLGWIRCGSPGLLGEMILPEDIQELRSAAAMGVVAPVGSAEDVARYSQVAAGLHIPYWHMQNESLLAAAGEEHLPVFLSRHPGASIQEWIAAAEQIRQSGNNSIVLVEEGERTDSPFGRGIDIVAISHLCNTAGWPLLVAPGAAGVHSAQLGRIALGSIAAGADGIIIDAPFEQFQRMVLDIEVLEVPLERELVRPPSLHTVPTTDTTAQNQKSYPTAGTPVAADDSGVRVSFQGERGAYSEAAMRRYFEDIDTAPQPCASFHDVFVSVLNGTARYGIVPLENSLAGSVHESYDHFLQFRDVKIIGEVQIRIEHALIVSPGTRLEQIERVYSHPQALAQCSRFLQQFPGWERIPFYDTAGSVQHIAQSRQSTFAAIAGVPAAGVYHMEVLREGIENNPLNFTRFAVIARTEEPDPENPNKASMVFSTPDKPGALLRCMNILADHDLNLKKVESRPIFGKPWQYRFYVDVQVDTETARLSAALHALPAEAEDVRLIGCYPVRS